jgi:polyribonucleotide nucleotidyltransferase
MKRTEKSIELASKTLTLKTGGFAEQATASVMASYGETVVLATVVAVPQKMDLGYFPLTVDYQERLYAGGRIKGSRWVKREGRPSDDEILTSRLIDRSIRPLFPKDYPKEVQLTVTVLSVDLENSPDIVAAIASSAALAASTIPWKGPVGIVRVGKKDGKFVVNPLVSENGREDLDLIVCSTKKAVVMIESGANAIADDEMFEAISFAHKQSQQVIDLIDDFAKAVGKKKEKIVVEKPKAEIVSKIKKLVKDELPAVVNSMVDSEGEKSTKYEELVQALMGQFEDKEKEFVPEILEGLKKEYMRGLILKGKRVDGRKPDEIRALSSQVGILPRTHGSAIFQRGQTQVLTVATLGAPSMEQLIESAEGEETKRYIHHYSMPPYSLGEVGRVGSPSRREIGHGALAERALEPVIPEEKDFPYTIRVVSEVLSSNGSTSMASTCGSTLSLMDAGVPITAPVSGIAMGLVIGDEKNYTILTDIMGLEDFDGDMDFKVAGTKNGITALQLDVKTLNFTLPILKEALEQAKKARLKVLESMLATIAKPRAKLSIYAPKIKMIKIPVEKIGEIIGPGGKTIKGLIAETGAQIDIEDDGSVNISGVEEESVDKAIEKIQLMTKEVQPGEIYQGEVKRVESFGAFIEILPGRDGMVHVSDMSTGFVKDAHDVVKIGDSVKVRVKEIDDLGRINLSMLLEGDVKKPNSNLQRRAPDRGFRQRRFERRNDNKGRDERRSSGPHFPTSRYISERKKY